MDATTQQMTQHSDEKLESIVTDLLTSDSHALLIRGYTTDEIKEMIRIGKALPCCEELEDVEDVLYGHYFEQVKPYSQEYCKESE